MCWANKAYEIQSLADKGDTCSLFSAIKTTYDPITCEETAVKDQDGTLLKLDSKSMNHRRMEHSRELQNRDSSVDESS